MMAAPTKVGAKRRVHVYEFWYSFRLVLGSLVEKTQLQTFQLDWVTEETKEGGGPTTLVTQKAALRGRGCVNFRLRA